MARFETFDTEERMAQSIKDEDEIQAALARTQLQRPRPANWDAQRYHAAADQAMDAEEYAERVAP